MLGHLKSFVKSLDNPLQKDTSLTLIPAYLLYVEAYYHQLSRQVLLLTLNLHCHGNFVLILLKQ